MSRLEELLNENYREDKFEPEKSALAFPCCCCKHNELPACECYGCRHFNH